MSPSETTCENPMPRVAAQSISAVAIAPDCDSSASCPGAAPICAKLALSFAGGTISPTVFGPITRSRCGRAASSIAWRRPFSTVTPAVITTATLHALRAELGDDARAPCPAGVRITARSGTPGQVRGRGVAGQIHHPAMLRR